MCCHVKVFFLVCRLWRITVIYTQTVFFFRRVLTLSMRCVWDNSRFQIDGWIWIESNRHLFIITNILVSLP
jgi:hypothetical protein